MLDLRPCREGGVQALEQRRVVAPRRNDKGVRQRIGFEPFKHVTEPVLRQLGERGVTRDKLEAGQIRRGAQARLDLRHVGVAGIEQDRAPKLGLGFFIFALAVKGSANIQMSF